MNGIAIAEFGFAEPFEAYKTLREDILTHPLRTLYYHDYVQAMLMAVQEGVKLVGRSAWSMADNFEWRAGYTVRFGIQVSFTSCVQKKTYTNIVVVCQFDYARALLQGQFL